MYGGGCPRLSIVFIHFHLHAFLVSVSWDRYRLAIRLITKCSPRPRTAPYRTYTGASKPAGGTPRVAIFVFTDCMAKWQYITYAARTVTQSCSLWMARKHPKATIIIVVTRRYVKLRLGSKPCSPRKCSLQPKWNVTVCYELTYTTRVFAGLTFRSSGCGTQCPTQQTEVPGTANTKLGTRPMGAKQKQSGAFVCRRRGSAV